MLTSKISCADILTEYEKESSSSSSTNWSGLLVQSLTYNVLHYCNIVTKETNAATMSLSYVECSRIKMTLVKVQYLNSKTV